ncbi:MAG: hypothetical protein GY789_21645 [Hyphomicrobiales bacterium]|nr:hypothetical protein [Hyphomicrobiales bacterium]
MDTEFSKTRFGMSNRLENAICRVEEIDGYRNLHDAIPVFLFLASGVFATRSFFWLIDFTTWLGFYKLGPVLPSLVSFVLLFVVWVLTFLAFMSLLEWMKFRNIRTFANNRLSNLTLTADEVCELKHFVKSKTWKHDYILKDVVATLESADL